MSVRVRKSVLKLADNDATLSWYAKAVAAMRNRPATDSGSWSYQAAMHGFSAGLPAWQGVGPIPLANERTEYWNQCQHGSWFFLPWHRMYLAYFEQIVARTIVGLGGPADWSLPYWDYSDTTLPNARTLPAAFTIGTPASNPLNVAGRQLGRPGNTEIPRRDVSLVALSLTDYIADEHGGSPGFGGPRTGFSHGGGQHGGLEQLPHDMVHVVIGGIMGDPRTAALDPIFWLHHANIDRLWQVWLNLGGRRNPVDTPWLNMDFDFHSFDGAPAVLRVQQVLDTRQVLSGYVYEDVPMTGGVQQEALEAAAGITLTAGGSMKSVAPPVMLGMVDKPLALGAAALTTSLAIHNPPAPLAAALSASGVGLESVGPVIDTYLNFENVKGDGVAPIYDVYLNLPAGADPGIHEERCVGSLPMFGVADASIASEHQSGSGLHYVLCITDVLSVLRAQPGWQDSQLDVTLVPRTAMAADATVTVGRISLYAKAGRRER
ncbi:MAG: tyrosinase family protein [Chitinimonas sp.]|nr:tyrosinase family protein [Chitinimonas sp.]